VAGKIKFKKIVPPLIWAGVIFYLSSIPSLKSPFGIWDFYLRKAAHITEYLVLYLLVFPNADKNSRKNRIWILVIVFIYAVSDEFHQNFVFGRNMSIYDISIDWIGGLLGYIYYGIRKNAAIRSSKT
jgi:VanZ family protein